MNPFHEVGETQSRRTHELGKTTKAFEDEAISTGKNIKQFLESLY